jgi:hypothetical protein
MNPALPMPETAKDVPAAASTLDPVHPVSHTRLARHSVLRAREGVVEWPNARAPRAARVLSSLRSRGR